MYIYIYAGSGSEDLLIVLQAQQQQRKIVASLPFVTTTSTTTSTITLKNEMKMDWIGFNSIQFNLNDDIKSSQVKSTGPHLCQVKKRRQSVSRSDTTVRYCTIQYFEFVAVAVGCRMQQWYSGTPSIHRPSMAWHGIPCPAIIHRSINYPRIHSHSHHHHPFYSSYSFHPSFILHSVTEVATAVLPSSSVIEKSGT